MRNKVIKTISIFLVFVISLIALSSCGLINIGNSDNPTDGNSGDSGKGGMNGNHPNYNFYPDGYTCGFPDFLYQTGPELEFWWVETYDECLAAIELLKSHGSTFAENAIFTYEGDLFDTKYCFKISRTNIYTEKIKFGDNPFDRRAGDVEIMSYAFLEDVTIDEINYSDVLDYDVHFIVDIFDKSKVKETELSFDGLNCEFSDLDGLYYILAADKTGGYLLSISPFGRKNDINKSLECIKVVIDSLEWVG